MKDKKVTIIGLGLIGGSLARALREYIGITDITAINRGTESIELALKDGTISRGLNEINDCIFDSDIIFICTPVKRAIEYINILAGKVKPGCLITDVGSTKAEIVNYINKMPNAPLFIGGHPMAGTEKAGYAASFAHLFENAYYILSPSKTSSEESMNFMASLVKGMGGIPVIIDSEEHDRITGGISHIPHIIASALVNMVKTMDSPDGKMQMLAAGGFKDITRIASSSPEMWESIILSNKVQINEILDQYTGMLARFKDLIRNDDSKSIYDFFENAKDYRNTFSAAKTGLICPANELIVDIVDKPGIIGEITTILGQNEVNIKNINVSNSREFEQGCLRITLPDPVSVNIAFDLLADRGYKVYKNI